MKTYKNFINEVSLSRVWKHAGSKDKSFSIITAFRDENGLEKNIKLNKQLAGKIKNSGFGYFYLDGHWIENQGEAEEINVAEKSIFIVGDSDGKLKGLVKKWIKEYNQDACIFKPSDSEIVELIFQDGSTEKVGKFRPNKISQAYSKLKNGRTFIFENAYNGDNNITKYSKKISQDLFEMANIHKDKTKLPLVIYISINDGSVHGARIKVNNNYSNKYSSDNLSITIEDEPKIIGWNINVKEKDLQKVREFVIKFKKILLKHWNDKIDSYDVIDYIKKNN